MALARDHRFCVEMFPEVTTRLRNLAIFHATHRRPVDRHRAISAEVPPLANGFSGTVSRRCTREGSRDKNFVSLNALVQVQALPQNPRSETLLRNEVRTALAAGLFIGNSWRA